MANFDTIRLNDLSVMGTHGVLESEHVEPQEFKVCVKITFDTSKAIASDDIKDTINYAEVADTIVAVVQGEHCDLIETLAQRIADALLTPEMCDIEVTVHKPNAPIPHTFGDVSVTIFRTHEVSTFFDEPVIYTIGLGSNLENPEKQIAKAVAEFYARGWDVEQKSGLYKSAPILAEGQDEQPAYYNAVVNVRTSESPKFTLDFLQHVERGQGRKRVERWGARTLDLDIIAIEGREFETSFLTVPHPRAHERRFVLEPWLEIDPDATLGGTPISELVKNVQDQDVTRVGEIPEVEGDFAPYGFAVTSEYVREEVE